MPQPIGVFSSCESTKPTSRSTVAGTRSFKALLRDNRTVTVQGHALQFLRDTYGVAGRVGLEEVLVAVFAASELVGIFDGELKAAQEYSNSHGGADERC